MRSEVLWQIDGAEKMVEGEDYEFVRQIWGRRSPGKNVKKAPLKTSTSRAKLIASRSSNFVHFLDI